MANWSDLLPEIVSKIAGEIYYYEDLVNFLGVCSSWERAVAEDQSFVEPVVSRLPCLMLAESSKTTTEEEEEEYRQLFLLSNGGVLRKVYLPEARNQRIVSSSTGWLLTVAEDDDEAKLVHPFSRVRIDLPKLTTFPNYDSFVDESLSRQCIKRVMLTSSIPSDPCFRVIVILGNASLGFCKLGDESWTLNSNENEDIWIDDVTYHHGRRKAYAVDVCGPNLFEWDFLGPDPTNMFSLSSFPEELSCAFSASYRYSYVIEWDVDNLLIVMRNIRLDDGGCRAPGGGFFLPYDTVLFEAFLFDLNNNNWTKMKSLGNKAVFLGNNSSFVVDVTTTHGGGCDVKPDCIYYTDSCFGNWVGNREGGGKDMGIYHMTDGNITPYYKEQLLSQVSPPLWLSPLL